MLNIAYLQTPTYVLYSIFIVLIITIQLMHGSECTLKYDEPEVENVARVRSSHERPCFICFVVWPTTSLKLYIVF